MTDGYSADQLEVDLNATTVTYRRWLNNQDEWTSLDDDGQRARLHRLATELAEVVRELTAAVEQEGANDVRQPTTDVEDDGDDEFRGKVDAGGGTSFETYAYFEDGHFVVADDDDEEWVGDLADIRRHEQDPGFRFPDNDGSLLTFVPSDPDAFDDALEAVRGDD